VQRDNPLAKVSYQNKVFALSFLLLLCAGAAAYYFFESKKPRYRSTEIKQTTREVVVVGEVVDAWCYASQTMGPGRGPGHRACALACAHGGVSIGILEDGTKDLYVAAKYKGFQGCKDLLIPYMGEKVKATGWVGDLGGCRMLKIKTVEALTKPDLDN
jgi:hypothetical protein